VASSSRLQVDVSTPVSSEAHLYTADTTRQTLASIHMRTKAKVKPPKKTLRQSAIPVTESDKLMNAETYIGPLKKKGRPKTTNTEAKVLALHSVVSPSDSGTQEVIVIDESDSDSDPAPAVKTLQVKSDDIRTPVSRDTSKRNRKTKQPLTAPFSTGPLTRRAKQSNETPALEPKIESHEPSILDILAYLSATSPEPNAQNATILAALNSIDSPESPASGDALNTGLVSALKHLLFLYSKSVNQEIGPPQKNPISPSHDDGIVILDKENINPSKIQKKSEKDSHTRKFSDSSSLPSSGLHSPEQTSHPERHIKSLKPSARPNDKPPLKESILTAGSDRGVRKRTLSEFMDEKDSSRSRGKGKERERVERRDGHRHSHLQHAQRSVSNDSLRHYPRLAASDQPRLEQPSSYYRTGMEPWSSPPRPYATQDHGGETLGGANIFREHQSSKISASSPVRSVQAQRDARKKYVVPEWARTSTATQPRLSEEAQWALEEAEQKKKQERSLARKRLSMQNKSGTRGANASILKPKKAGEENTPSQKPQLPQGPIAAANSGPLFAVADISLPMFASTRSSSPPPKPPSIPKTPKTPTRNRPIRATPGKECDSLFTPVMRSGSLFGSANSHSSRTTFSLTFTSPLGNRKKARIAPERSILRLKGAVLADAWSTAESADSKTEVSEQPDEDPGAALNQKLENAFDDLDCPPSSLPIASSDIDVDNPSPETFKDLDPMDADDETETKLDKPYWPGLPPSSPPPPSSPMRLPEAADFEFQTDEEMDNLELPVATDSETDPDVTAFDTDFSSPSESPAYCNDDQNETASTADEFSAYFPQLDHSPDVRDNPTLTMDVFEQFTNFNNEDLQGYEGVIPNSDLDSVFQNGLDGIDFTEFWETFKPLIDDNAKTYHGDSTHEEDVTIGSFENIDPTKLADEMQTLLSGCLM
jgi:hypothetical protein